MDMEISQVKPQYFYSLQQYNRILNHRNNLLKEINEKSSLRKTLPIWDEQLAKVGTYIMKERMHFTDNLRNTALNVHKEISFNKENLEVLYNPSIGPDSWDVEDIMEKFMKTLEMNHEDDIRKGRTEKGCHRDDIILNINGMDVRTFGSQGQQRTTVLSLKLSEIEMMYRETGEYPLLLLDDVMSELDKYRQGQLLSYFDRVQTFMTMTDYKDLPENIGNSKEIYTISEGKAFRV